MASGADWASVPLECAANAGMVPAAPSAKLRAATAARRCVFLDKVLPFSTTGHHAGLHPSALDPSGDRAADKAVQQYLEAGVPASKLVLGVPFYGRAFTDVAPEHNGLQQKYGKFFGAPSWRELTADYIGKNGYVRYWDEQAQVPYLWNAKTHTFVSYEDPQSLRIKTGFINSRRLGGAMYWEQSLDKDSELLDVLVKGLHQP